MKAFADHKKHSKPLFLLLMIIQSEELKLSDPYVKFHLVYFYLLHAFCIIPPNSIKELLSSLILNRFFFPLMIGTIAFSLVLLLVHLYVLVLHFGTQRVPGWVIQATVSINYLFTYMIHPGLLLVYLLYIFQYRPTGQSEVSSNTITAFCIVHLLIMTAYNLCIIRLKLVLPTDSPASIIDPVRYCIFHLFMSVSQVLNSIRYLVTDISPITAYSLFSASLLLQILSLGISVYRNLSWNYSVNRLHVSILSKLLVLKVVSEFYNENVMYLSISFVIFEQLFTRLALNSLNSSMLVSLLDDKLDKFQLFKGSIIMCNLLVNRSDSESRPKEEHRLYKSMEVHYQGIWKKLLIHQGQSFRGFSVDHLITYITKKHVTKEEAMSRLLLILQATDTIKYLRMVRHLCNSAKKKNSSGFFSRFESFQLETLWIARFEDFYRHYLRTDERSGATASTAFSNLSVVSEHLENIDVIQKEGQMLDCKKVFLQIDYFEMLSTQVQSLSKSQANLYELLTMEGGINLIKARTINSSTLRCRRDIKNSIKLLLLKENPAELYSYFYPTIIYFYTLIQYEIEQSDKFVMYYKKKLATLLVNSTYRRIPVNRIGIEADAVALQISLEKDTLGQIVDISLNAGQYLGKSSEGPVIRKNINIMLPPILWDAHLQAMAQQNSLVAMYKDREICLNDLRGYLKMGSLNIRLAASLSDVVSAYSLLMFNVQYRGPSLILDSRLNIIAADGLFTEALRSQQAHLTFSSSLSAKGIDISCLSRWLHHSLKLLTQIQSYFKREAIQTSLELEKKAPNAEKLTMSSSERIRDRLFSILNLVVEQNRGSGLLYSIESDSLLFSILGCNSVHIRFQYCSMIGVEVIKVFLSRKQRFANNSIQNKPQMNVVPSFNDSPELFSDEDSNKAVHQIHEHHLQDYSSDVKDSNVVNRKIGPLLKQEDEDSVLHKFDELISPALEAIEGGAVKISKSPEEEKSFDVGKSLVSDKNELSESFSLWLESNPKAKEIVDMIKVLRRQSKEPGASFVSESNIPQFTTINNHQHSSQFHLPNPENIIKDKHLSLGPEDYTRSNTQAVDTRAKPQATLGDSKQQNKINIVKLKEGKEGFTKPALNIKKKTSKKPTQLEGEVRYEKVAPDNEHARPQSSNDFSVASRRSHENIKVATFHTITKLLSVLSVAACDSVQR